MNSIGFKNFRKFRNFKPIEYNGITFLVGRNNAGKSTLVKALLLVDNYFKSQNIKRLTFGSMVLDDANIVTYGRALNRSAWESNENFISFEYQFERYRIDLTISSDFEDESAYVVSLGVVDSEYYLAFNFDIRNGSLTILKNKSPEDSLRDAMAMTMDEISVIEGRILEIETALKERIIEAERKQTNSTNYKRDLIQLNSDLISLKKKRNMLAHNQRAYSNSLTQKEFELNYEYNNLGSLMEIVKEATKMLMRDYKNEYEKAQKGGRTSKKFEDLRALKEFDPVFVESSFSHFMALMSDYSIEYLAANPAKQSALFAIRDKNNALAQAIHEFKQLKIAPEQEEHRFVLKWMQEFEVGEGFTINMCAGEAYEMKINSKKNEINLADKGMGSIQAMLLILRIACLIKKIKLTESSSPISPVIGQNRLKQETSRYRLINKTTVIIEEPELNLHPALQSKLADMFLEVHEKFNINFIIETHSEYLIRKTQFLVKNNEYEVKPNENPFKVIYFDSSLEQWQMNYREDGVFKEDFGPGFFDVSRDIVRKLL